MLPIVTNAPSIENAAAPYALTLSILVAVLVLVLVVLREYLDAAREDSYRWRVDILDIAIVPLLCTFGLLVILRVIDLVALD